MNPDRSGSCATVVGVMFELDDSPTAPDNPFMDAIWNVMPKNEGVSAPACICCTCLLAAAPGGQLVGGSSTVLDGCQQSLLAAAPAAVASALFIGSTV